MENKIIFLILLILLVYLVFTQKGQELIKKVTGGISVGSREPGTGIDGKKWWNPAAPDRPGDYPTGTPGQAMG
jgi:hypothetical protein